MVCFFCCSETRADQILYLSPLGEPLFLFSPLLHELINHKSVLEFLLLLTSIQASFIKKTMLSLTTAFLFLIPHRSSRVCTLFFSPFSLRLFNLFSTGARDSISSVSSSVLFPLLSMSFSSHIFLRGLATLQEAWLVRPSIHLSVGPFIGR